MLLYQSRKSKRGVGGMLDKMREVNIIEAAIWKEKYVSLDNRLGGEIVKAYSGGEEMAKKKD